MPTEYRNRAVALLVFVLLLKAALLGKEFPQESTHPKVADSPKGFEHQYREFFNAYMKGNSQKTEGEMLEFAVPEHWFIDLFGPDAGPEIRKQYVEDFREFEASTLKRLGAIVRCDRCLISLDTKAMYSTEVRIRPGQSDESLGKDTGKAFQLPPLQRFQIHYVDRELREDYDGTGHSFVREIPWGNGSWMDSFVYVDRAFRFFGKGSHSFWDAPRIHLADPCSKDGSQPGGHIIHRVIPIYPDEAKQRNIKGIVRLLVTVSVDGAVKDMKVIDGDPLLLEAAEKAVSQWRYEPFINCGKPVAMQSIEHVKFPP